MKNKITIIGAGYVGLSLSVLLAKSNEVILYEIDKKKVDMLNQKKSTINDPEITKRLKSSSTTLRVIAEKEEAFVSRDIYIVATPTNYSNELGSFDTSIVESNIKDILQFSSSGLIVIKSTIPVGFTDFINNKFNTDRIVFSPEFLREGSALEDNLNPSRIVIGGTSQECLQFGELLKLSANSPDVEVLFMNSSEAEAVKLFSNTYLALRVAFFNELDSFALEKNLDAKNIISAVSLDARIGKHYNNPSFGYGGYCLPKDTQQLLANYEDVPQNLIQSIITANQTRKEFIAQKIILKKPKIVGIYRLVMKQGSDNFRSSSIIDIINLIAAEGIKIIVYESDLDKYDGDLELHFENSFKVFAEKSDLIIANRLHEELDHVSEKVFSRDIFGTS